MNLNIDEIREAVIAKVSSEVLGGCDVESIVQERIEKMCMQKVNEIFAKEATAQIAQAIDTAVKGALDQPYFRVDGFGKQNGESTTIRKSIEDILSSFWTTRVDPSNGKPIDMDRDYYGKKVTRAEYIMMESSAGSFKEIVQRNAIDMCGAMKDGLRTQLFAATKEIMDSLFRVSTKGDKEPIV